MSHTILCVEDEQDTGDLMKAILEREGYVVIRATDGRQAIDVIDSIQPPSLILLDIVVPFANGFKLLAMLRQKQQWQQVPIIMVSADSYPPDIQRTMTGGATAYVVKKPGLHNLLEMVRHVLHGGPGPKPEPEPASSPTPATRSSRAYRPVVMIVEDHEDTASLLRLLLEQEGYTVIRTADGESAHQLITSTAPPDMILLDLTLPTMSGLQLLQIIRMSPEWQWTPVLILTADNRVETITNAINLGATQYVQKPFVAAHLLQSVRQFTPAPQPGRERRTGA
ncbi:MAG: response regulator [Nitrospira sp.]|nr:response regulator [Nitrospira sp.]